jgi:hypothetical protein
MAYNWKYATPLISCDPRIRGFAICNQDGKCSACDYAKKFEDDHPGEVRA